MQRLNFLTALLDDFSYSDLRTVLECKLELE